MVMTLLLCGFVYWHLQSASRIMDQTESLLLVSVKIRAVLDFQEPLAEVQT